MKNSALIWIITGIVGLTALWMFLIRKKPAQAGSNSSGNENPAKVLYLNRISFPITQGDTGKEVAYVQGYLNKYKNTNLVIDGIFGPNTRAAFAEQIWLPYGPDLYKDKIPQVIYESYIKEKEQDVKNYLATQNILI